MLFSGPMVRAILDGTKAQTRRVITCPHKPYKGRVYEAARWTVLSHSGGGWRAFDGDRDPGEVSSRGFPCPYGAPGDRLWVRETFIPDPPIDGWDGDVEWNGCGRPVSGVPEHYRKPEHCIYAATWNGGSITWNPSIHMPRWASRITLEVTDVRVERLRDISTRDCWAEGIPASPDVNPQHEFIDLWDSLNAKRAPWDSNPWVWVVSFRQVQS